KVREMLKEIIGDEPEEKIAFELTLDKSLLKGSLGNIYNNRIIFVSYSKKENKYLLEAYISYLAVIASGMDYELLFISAAREEVFQAVRIPKAEALERLTSLMQLYKLGHDEIIAFFPDFDIVPGKVDGFDEFILAKAVKDFFENYRFPCTDRYLMNEFKNRFFQGPDIVSRYKSNALLLVKPLGEMFPGYY
ncbi:MAG TPA: hypothetical protein VEZ17_15535, partial [Chitinophagaceae bacterium]|nr:hypothetical protein [Chitinophagaceae bacterium]